MFFIFDKYIARPIDLELMFLAEYASYCTSSTSTTMKRKHASVIRYIQYNEHKDPDNFLGRKGCYLSLIEKL